MATSLNNPWLAAPTSPLPASSSNLHGLAQRALDTLTARRHWRRRGRGLGRLFGGHSASSSTSAFSSFSAGSAATLAVRARSIQHLQRSQVLAESRQQRSSKRARGVKRRGTDGPLLGQRHSKSKEEIERLRRIAVDYYADERRARQRFLALFPRFPLWQHQREGVAFLVEREASGTKPIRGGILGDSMRAGKSLQLATVIVADAQHRLENGGSRFGHPTLIVAPTTNVGTWRAEFQKHFGASEPLAVGVMARRASLGSDIGEADIIGACDVVITTYSTVAAAWRRGGRGAFGALLRVHFRRIVADEAHVLANAPAVLHAAMCALRADIKWYVSGTPLQNSRESLHNILRFLGVPSTELPSLDAASCRAMLQPMMLRRHVSARDYTTTTTTATAPSLDAEESTVQRNDSIVLLDFSSAAERTAYAHVRAALLHANKKKKKKKKHRKRKRGDDYEEDEEEEEAEGDGRKSALFDHITRLRQLCVSPNLVPPDAFAALMRDAPVTLLRADQLDSPDALLARLVAAEEEREENTEPRAAAYLWLLSLAEALGDAALHERVLACARNDPACERMSHVAQLVRETLLPPLSTKERWLVNYLRNVVEPAGEKLVVFSGWATFIDRLAWVLAQRPEVREQGSVRVLKAHGGMADRDAVLTEFASDPRATCLLVTHGTCATGIDLSCANHIVLCDPWWNPTVEDQAFARAFGVNQRRRVVHTLRLVMHDTIDAYVVAYADKMRRDNETLLGDDAAGALRPPPSLLLDWLARGSQ